ncbi:unnamed protein product [Orchesella dallaii]|uniref:Neprilysin n=2 Tax=Orchesella dallaii TaxID=48710 RepID=A0ABP1R995_9HEXA
MGKIKQGPGERKLQIVLGVLSLITIGLIITTTFFGVQLKKKNDELKVVGNVCDTKECVTAAGDMIKSMDLSASPCDNFFQFACGNWLKNNPIPDTASSWNQFNVLRDHLNRKIREILERKMDEKDPLPLNIAKKFYSSCLAQNTTSHEELSELMNQVLDDGNFNPNELGQKLGELRRVVAGNFLISTSVSLDEENTSRHTIYIDQPSLGLNRIYMVQTPEHAYKGAYVELIQEIWETIYPNITGNYTEIAIQIVDFETKIAEISTKPEDRRDRTKLYNPMTIAQLSNLTSKATMINWEKYIEEIFKDVPELGDIKLLRVIVRDIPYFMEFGNILQNATNENRDIIWNYLRWRVILNYANDVNNNLRDILFHYAKKTQGTMYPPPRWQVCSDRANSLFGMAISYHYVQDAFTSDFQHQMKDMIGNIQQAFYDILNEIDWFGDVSTKVKAKQKAEKMKNFIGYPEWLLNEANNHSALREEYDGVPQNMSDDHFINMRELIDWKNLDNLKHIKRSKNPLKWISDPTVVNAFYSSTYNSITFPGGILQPPFYFTGKPIQALNYGAIGMVIGHEITHGFDDRGRQSDGDGDLVDWWDENTVNEYTERAKCFVNQYENYTAEEANDMPLNGNNTLGENIADNGGIRQAFRAYRSFIQKNGPEPRLPGLSFTPEQLFFVAFSQIWCGAYTKQGMESQIKTGVHSPNRFRVRGVLQNSFEFAETWNCPRPNEKSVCRIW